MRFSHGGQDLLHTEARMFTPKLTGSTWEIWVGTRIAPPVFGKCSRPELRTRQTRRTRKAKTRPTVVKAGVSHSLAWQNLSREKHYSRVSCSMILVCVETKTKIREAACEDSFYLTLCVVPFH